MSRYALKERATSRIDDDCGMALQLLLLASPGMPRATRWFAYSVSGVLLEQRDEPVFVTVDRAGLNEHGSRLLSWPHINFFAEHKAAIEELMGAASD